MMKRVMNWRSHIRNIINDELYLMPLVNNYNETINC